MQILKLALPLAAMLMAGQALAHKAPHATSTAMAPARLTSAQTDTNPAALLGSIGGRNAPGTVAMSALMPQEPPAKGTSTVTRINRSH